MAGGPRSASFGHERRAAAAATWVAAARVAAALTAARCYAAAFDHLLDTPADPILATASPAGAASPTGTRASKPSGPSLRWLLDETARHTQRIDVSPSAQREPSSPIRRILCLPLTGWITRAPRRPGFSRGAVDHQSAARWISPWVPLKVPSPRKPYFVGRRTATVEGSSRAIATRGHCCSSLASSSSRIARNHAGSS